LLCRRFSSYSPFAVAACVALALVNSVSAHPIHRSIAEADYNRVTAKLEVAVRVFADDFEAALSARAGRKISLEKTPTAELDALARAYLVQHFTVKSPDGAAVTLEWRGRELKDGESELWLYFEVALPGGMDGAKVHHGVLFDQFRDQLNSLLVRDGDRKLTLFFLSNHGEKTVRFPPGR
jgi:hypothetical protein